MYKRLKVKLYPNKNQIEMLENHFNGYRYCYNLCLEYKQILWNHHKISVSGFTMQSELFKIRKQSNWLIKCKAECIRQAGGDVEKSYVNFFKGAGFPKFKSKKGIQSFTAYQAINCKNNKLSFYKNKIRIRDSIKYKELLEMHKIKRCTFKKDSCGDYWATLLIEIEDAKTLPNSVNIIGIDLGIKDLIITSEGEVFENKKLLQSNYYKLRRLQRKFSKTKKGGKNKEILRIKIAKINRKICRQKEHYYHQITNTLLRDNQTIVMETLNVKEMMKEKKLSRNISDASWGLLTQMLEYKSNWYGRDLIKINQWFPSSKTCSNCGNIKEILLLSERIYKCEVCKTEIDRDLNAAINIKNTGIKIPEESVEEKRITSPKKQKLLITGESHKNK
jgi:putative transposase